MGRLEVNCRRFAILSGIEQGASDYTVCVHPAAPGLQRKGTLAIITESSGAHGSLGLEACKLVQRTTIETYFADNSLSLTSSLLNALDQANTELLNYNYNSGNGTSSAMSGGGSEVGGHGGSNRPRRAKVGATAVLIRPDGEGIYLSQMAPTQAYILHNGLLSAIPEPEAWKQAPQRTVAVMSGMQGSSGVTLEDKDELGELPAPNLPSPSLGSGPGIEADLIYRRVAPGDMIVLVSTSLSRLLDRERAEQIFSRYDADGVVRALYSIASDNGVAEAHACVLELGVEISSGVEEDYITPVKPQPAVQIAENGGISAGPTGPQKTAPPMHNLNEVLRGPRDWLQRRKAEPKQAAHPLETSPAEEQDQDLQEFWSQQPTQRFPQRPADLPPYKARQKPAESGVDTESAQPVGDHWEDGNGEELQFDGWEDAPPALDDPRYDDSHKVVFKPRSYDIEGSIAEADSEPEIAELPAPAETGGTGGFQRPSLFGGNRSGASVQPLATKQSGHTLTAAARPSKFDVSKMAGTAGTWVVSTARALLPERLNGGAGSGKMAGTKGVSALPLRLVIAGALVLAALLFVFSVLSMVGNTQKAATHNLLQEAQQMETLANQPGMLAEEKLQKLQLALAKAQEAAQANPQSAEAKLLVTKIQGEIDQAQGITRFGSIKPLFDLDVLEKAGSGAAAGDQNSASSTTPLTLNDLIVQNNDAYLLDRTTNKIYRCQIEAAACSAILTGGETAGGAIVGKVVAMTSRMGNLVALDDSLTVYVLSPDTGAWQAEKLGGTDGFQTPKAIATYDGNLYLLEAKPGQISKYASGQYGQPPIDWIQGEATIDAMKTPLAMAIDGEIYVALTDGKILVMQGGKISRTLTPQIFAGQGAPTRLFTGTDVKDLYAFRAEDGTITRISKEGQAITVLKAPVGAGLETLSGLAVDEGRGKYYLVSGRKVFEAVVTTAPASSSAPANVAPAIDTSQPADKAISAPGPSVRPTAAP